MADKYISQITPLGSSTTYLLKDKKAIENITRSGTTFTATRRDGTTFTFTQQDNNADILVKQTAKTDNKNYKILTTVSDSPTSGNSAEVAYDTDITLNPNTNTITATHFAGSATNAKNTQSNHGQKGFTVDGDANTYYPTLFSGFTQRAASTLLSIHRGYSDTAPDTWNTSTHRGGLTLTILSNGDTAYGGNHAIGVQKLNTILILDQTYCTMVGDILDTNFGLVVWLRGGGAKYYVTSNGGQSVLVTTWYESHTQGSNTVAPITTVNTNRINSYRWENLWTVKNATNAATADKVDKALKIQGNGTDSFSFDGSAAKTLNIKAGNNVSVSSDTSGNITIASSYTNSRDEGYGKITPAGDTGTSAVTANTTQIKAKSYNEAFTFKTGNKWLTVAGTESTTAGSDVLTIGHSVPSSISNTGPTSAQTPGYGSTFNIPVIAVDAAGHVTGVSTTTVKIPASDNTNTATAADNILDGSNSGTQITYAPYSAQQSKLSFDTSAINPTRTDRLNLNGYLYATKVYSGGAEVLTAHQSLANYKTKQTAISNNTGTSESTTATRFIYSISQNENGEISVKTRPLPTYNNYSLPLAANGTRGGIQIGYSESGNNYAVKLSSEKAYVTVPWTDYKVRQTNDASTNANYRLLLSNSANDTQEDQISRKNANLIYNPSTNKLSTGNLDLTGVLNVTGNANFYNQTNADSLTVGSLLVNGNANFVQSPTAPTPASGDNSTKLATTEFVKTSVAGLSGAMHFRGTTTTEMTDGRTTAAVTIGGSSYTPAAGDVVLYSDSEFVWTGSAWERLGRDSSFKTTQSAVDSGTAATNKWVSRLQQNANGVITATMASLDTSGTWSGNAATATAFSSNATVTLTGDTTGVSAGSTKSWSVSTKTDRLSTEGDKRAVATIPNDYANKFIFRGLKTNSSFDSPSSDAYSYVMGLRGWSDSSGGDAHELAFNNTGIFHRSGATTTWDDWEAIGNIRWNAITQGQKWSRICLITPKINTEGSSGILSISCTRGSVVVNATFLITASHAGTKRVQINQLGSSNYSSVKIRGVCNTGGTAYIELYDTANSIASGTTQTWHCVYNPLLNSAVTTYTTFTNGTTIPSGYTAYNELSSFTGDDASAIVKISRSGTTFTATRQNGTTFTFTQQDNNSITGVKGNAESSYRTGNVNLTPANILGTGTTAQFWRGDNSWSSTLGGSLTITKAGECGVEVDNTQTTNPHKGLFGVGSSGNLGIYDRTYNKWVVYSDPSGNVVLNGNANTATKTGVSTIWLYPENNNEINFGGTNTGTTIYFGYRKKDSRNIPTKFVFGSSTGTADLQVKTVYLGSGTTSYVSSTQYTGNAATATALSPAGTTAQYWRGDNSWQTLISSGTSTLAWNSEVTLATVGGTAIKAKLPANPNTNTDTLVKQTAKSDDKNYKILTTVSDSPTSGNSAEVAYDTGITINPSSHTLQTDRYFHNVISFGSTATPKEILIKTKIPFANGNSMPKIIFHMYNYTSGYPTELTLAFYIYNNAFCNYGVTSNTAHRPIVTLSTYTEDSNTYVAIGLGLIGTQDYPDAYYVRFNIDVLDIWGSSNRNICNNWTVTQNTSSTSIIPTDNRKTIDYRDVTEKTRKNLIIKLKSGTTEDTDLYTFNGSAAKTLDIKQGTGITLTAAAGSLTITNAGVTGVKGNNESSYRTGNVNLTPANVLGTGTTGQFWRGDNDWSNMLSGAHTKSLATFVATAGSDDAWNKAGNYNLALVSSNNMLAFTVGGTSNDRNANIQVGHSNDTSYGHIIGSLYLNKLGGQVYINNNYAAKVTSATSGQVMVADGTTGGIKTTGYTIATSVPSGAVFTDTKNTAGSTNTSSKIFLIGATSQAANPQTYSDDQVYVTSGTLTANKIEILSTQDAAGTADSKPALIIGGASTAQHIEIDGNEILSKSNGTTPSTLYLQDSTGAVQVAGSGGLTVTSLTASQAVVTDANKKLVSRGIRNNTAAGALGWTSASTDITLVTTNTIAYWNGAYTSTSSNLKYSANGEIMGLSSAQTVSGTKTFSAIQKFTNTTDSAHSTDTTAAVSISGGLSVAKKVSAKEVRIDNNQTSKGVSLQYDSTLEVLNFVFS